MIKRIGLLGLALWTILGGASAARAGDEPAGQAYLVLIGVNNYPDPQIKPRRHAEADAKALHDLFAAKDHLGVKADHIKLLLGADATRKNILDAAAWLQKSAKKDDLVVFAFFGQGAPIGERSCYFAFDSTYQNRAKDAVASGDLEQPFDKLVSNRFVAFIDVNFLGFDAGKEKAPDPNIQNFYREFLGGDENKASPLSRAVFLANPGLKPSLDLDTHGAFAQAVINGLEGKADVEGYEPDGNITVGELAKFVRKELSRLVRAAGKTDEEKGQNVVVLEGQASDFVVDLNPAPHKLAADRLKAFDKFADEKSLAKPVIEEGRNLLARMPKLEAQQNLRKAYQKLADGKLDADAFNALRSTILESTVLSEAESNRYAISMLRALRMVRSSFVKDTNAGSLVEQSITGMYKSIDEKIPSELKERLAAAKNLKENELIKLLADARKQLGKREDLAKTQDITNSLHYVLGKLDKHTDYIPPEVAKKFGDDLKGSFFGIGVQIRKHNIRDQLQVVTPIIGSPAYKAGLQANDIITTIVREVDNEGNPFAEPEIISTKGMTTEEAVKKIVGKEGTKVRLLVDREGSEKPLEFNLLRGKVEVESVLGAKRNNDDSWNYVVDPENKICYVRLTQFTHNTHRDLEKVMKKLYQAGIKGFVLDLRFNPGGVLDGAVKISDLFIDDGLIVTIKPRSGPETSYVGKSDGSFTSFPMVCLVNGYSASASEIVSACLQDHGRAVIVGTRSYGKGSVQTIQQFSDTGGLLKLTTATFWRPNGRNLNKASTNGKDEDEWGVTPDKGFDIKLSTKELNDLQDFQRDREIIRRGVKSETKNTDFRDRQLDAAMEYLRGQIRTAAQGSAKKEG